MIAVHLGIIVSSRASLGDLTLQTTIPVLITSMSVIGGCEVTKHDCHDPKTIYQTNGIAEKSDLPLLWLVVEP